MNIHINLSSEPFRRDRPWIVATVALGAVLTVTLAILTYLAIGGRDEAFEARQEATKAQAQLTTLIDQQNQLEGALLKPENGEVIERSVFLNLLLLRKGISWTRIFADLEKVVPYNVRVIQIRPAVTPNNEIYLEMVVGSQTPEPVIDMLMKLESSEQFGATHIANMLPPSQTEPLFRYRINVNYAQKL
jgi:type IV pilus assembly protein PilN